MCNYLEYFYLLQWIAAYRFFNTLNKIEIELNKRELEEE